MAEGLKDQLLKQLSNDKANWNGYTGETFYMRKKQAIEDFKLAGLPTIKDEEWKYTNLSKLFKKLSPKGINKKFTDSLQSSPSFGDVHLIVLENGQLNTKLSDNTMYNKVFIGSLEESWSKYPNLYVLEGSVESRYNKMVEIIEDVKIR